MPIANPDPASPKLRTVLCSAEFELPPADTDTLAGALDDNYGPPDERDGTDGTARVRRWDYVAPGALGPRILAALTLTGTLLSVESNGTRRFDKVIAVVRDPRGFGRRRDPGTRG